jgi:hypothetical protein
VALTDRADRSDKRSARIPAAEVDGGNDVKLVPGGTVDLINLSDTGALVESKTRCAVGAAVTLCVGGDNPRRLQARVVRCNVSAIHRDSSMSYQLALTFDDGASADAISAQDVTVDAPAAAAVPVAPPPAVVLAAAPVVEELVNEW